MERLSESKVVGDESQIYGDFAGRLNELAIEYKEIKNEKINFRSFLGEKGISVQNLADLNLDETRKFSTE